LYTPGDTERVGSLILATRHREEVNLSILGREAEVF
jgi:hypothetical protein